MSAPDGHLLLHELFDRLVERWPNHLALDIPSGSERPNRITATYADLDALSRRIESRLRPIARPDAVVATLLPRTTLQAFAANVAILRSGSAFTCIDPAFPDARVTDLIDDSQALAVLTDQAGQSRLCRAGIAANRIIVLDENGPANASSTAARSGRQHGLSPGSLAYLIYTSGTTGHPKGVMIEHRSIVNLIAGDLIEFGVGPGDRIAQHSSHAYDSSVEETWLALASGATLVVVDDEVARSGPDLISWLEREQISILCPTPTLLRATGARTSDGLLPRLRLIYAGGEAMTPDVVGVWAPRRRMINGYGPTECAVTSVRTDIHAGDPVTIGRPVPNATVAVLDDELADVADGTPGELFIGGAGLARGYWRDPELTARKFLVHPRHGRLYRTGDLGVRAADGTLTCLGRVDSQVKVRGYRIELEEIETRLAACDGVLGAACRVQTDGGRSTLVGFVVPANPMAPPDFDFITRSLATTVPSHMVPARLQLIDALPLMPSGKLNRAALPNLAYDSASAPESVVSPRTTMEARIETALRRATGRTTPISITANFFEDLGGDSLLAAQLITALRADADTAALTVRDAYAEPTIERLARKAAGLAEMRPASPRSTPARGGRPVLATILQLGWLAAEVVIVSAVAYFAAAAIWPLLFDRVSPLTIAIGLPLVGSLAVFLYIPLSLATVVLLKRLLIGKYQAGRWPVWGTYYVRHWAVCQVLRTVPWRFLEGTDFQLMALRALGARIGRRVHIHRGVDLLQGGWDLLTIGDDVMIGQEATIRVVDLDDEELIADPVVIESAATVETRASVAGGATIRAGGYLTALSSLSEGATIPEGERWDGVPAARIGLAPATPAIDLPAPEFSPAAMGAFMLVSRLLSFMVVPTLSVWLAITLGATADASFLFAEGAWAVSLGMSVLIVPVVVALQAVAMRLAGPIKPGVMSRWSRDYVRVWIKTDLVRRAGDWLAGTLMWPIWLRAAGMKIGRDCEISTIIDVVPELVTIGPTTFFADGVYIGGPILHRGTVTLAHTHVGSEVFLGNHVVIPAGNHVADRVLIGVSTVVGQSAERAGSAWFGHPPFALARPQTPALDRRLTHHPSLIRYINRWVWEIGRFAIPAASAAVLLPTARLGLSAAAAPDATVTWTAFVVMPGLVVISAAAWCAFVLALKWLLLGRVRPGQHALWSCWCSRWDFHYMVWDRLARPFLARFDGTLLLAWYLRAMGMKIGKRVVLGPGFSQVVDPDMIEIEDDATVHALFQAHTFEDRVLKIDKVRIGRRATVSCGTVLFYGADVGDGASVAAQSVVMKHERLLPHQKYEGCPSGRRLEQTNDAAVFVQVDLLG